MPPLDGVLAEAAGVLCGRTKTSDVGLGGQGRSGTLMGPGRPVAGLLARGEPAAMSGWMRGEQVPPTATCQIRLDFFSSDVPVHGSDKAFLAASLDRYVAWGHAHHVPPFLGEFGAIKFSFDDDLGGLPWVGDMLDLIEQRHLNFSYHSYHEDAFGLYRGHDALPSTADANTALIELITRARAPSRHPSPSGRRP